MADYLYGKLKGVKKLVSSIMPRKVYAEQFKWDAEWDENFDLRGDLSGKKIKYLIMIACDLPGDGEKIGNSNSARKIADQLEGIFDQKRPSYFFIPTDEERTRFGNLIVSYLSESHRPKKFFNHSYIDPDVFVASTKADEETRMKAYVNGAGMEAFIANHCGVSSESDDHTSLTLVMASTAAIQYTIARLLQVPRAHYPNIEVNDQSLSVMKLEQNGNVILSQLGSTSFQNEGKKVTRYCP